MSNGRVRATLRTLLACASLAVLIVAASPASGSAQTSTLASFKAANKGPLPAPGGFQLQASNGYSLTVLGVLAHKGHPAEILLIVNKKSQWVTYFAPAVVTETSIQANLGELGEVSVVFHPSGQPTKARPQCGGRSVSFDSGYYEGKIDFHGEEGYTELDATSAPGSIDFLLNVLCSGGGGGRGPFLPGAELNIRNPGLGPKLSVVKNRPSARARVEVGVSEYHSGISIERSTTLLMPAGSFRYDPRLQAAILRPPAPFAGTGRFVRSRKASKRWSGDLTVDMPGREDVALTGSALRATLVHANWHGPQREESRASQFVPSAPRAVESLSRLRSAVAGGPPRRR